MAKTPPSTIPTEGFEATSISVLPTTAHSRLSGTTLPKCDVDGAREPAIKAEKAKNGQY
jgi:hypothetical protein